MYLSGFKQMLAVISKEYHADGRVLNDYIGIQGSTLETNQIIVAYIGQEGSDNGLSMPHIFADEKGLFICDLLTIARVSFAKSKRIDIGCARAV